MVLLTTGVGKISGKSGRGGVGVSVGDGVIEGVGETVGVALGAIVGVSDGSTVIVGIGVKVTASVTVGSNLTKASWEMGEADGSGLKAISGWGAQPIKRNKRTAVFK